LPEPGEIALPRPNENNPYIPIDPTGALLGLLALFALTYGRKKSRGRWDMLVILLVLGLSLGLGLAACGPTPVTVTDGTNTATITQVQTPTPSSTPTYIVAVTTPTATATFVLTPSETPEPQCSYPQPGTTPVPNDENHRSYGIGERFYRLFDATPGGWWDRYRDPDAGLWPILITMAFHWETYSLGHNSLFMAAMQEAFSRKLWGSYKSYGRDG
jgi:hypothetical protein